MCPWGAGGTGEGARGWAVRAPSFAGAGPGNCNTRILGLSLAGPWEIRGRAFYIPRLAARCVSFCVLSRAAVVPAGRALPGRGRSVTRSGATFTRCGICGSRCWHAGGGRELARSGVNGTGRVAAA